MGEYVDAAKFKPGDYAGRDLARKAYGSRLDNNPSQPLDDPDDVVSADQDSLYHGQGSD